jgi:hypothetical protein
MWLPGQLAAFQKRNMTKNVVMLLITLECWSWLSQGSFYVKVKLFLRISSGSVGDITSLPTPARNNAQYVAIVKLLILLQTYNLHGPSGTQLCSSPNVFDTPSFRDRHAQLGYIRGQKNVLILTRATLKVPQFSLGRQCPTVKLFVGRHLSCPAERCLFFARFITENVRSQCWRSWKGDTPGT